MRSSSERWSSDSSRNRPTDERTSTPVPRKVRPLRRRHRHALDQPARDRGHEQPRAGGDVLGRESHGHHGHRRVRDALQRPDRAGHRVGQQPGGLLGRSGHEDDVGGQQLGRGSRTDRQLETGRGPPEPVRRRAQPDRRHPTRRPARPAATRCRGRRWRTPGRRCRPGCACPRPERLPRRRAPSPQPGAAPPGQAWSRPGRARRPGPRTRRRAAARPAGRPPRRRAAPAAARRRRRPRRAAAAASTASARTRATPSGDRKPSSPSAEPARPARCRPAAGAGRRAARPTPGSWRARPAGRPSPRSSTSRTASGTRASTASGPVSYQCPASSTRCSLPPMRSPASRTTISSSGRRRRHSKAAARPVIPAPTTTSRRAVIGGVSSWTRSATWVSTPGSVSGSTPWPRLKMCPRAARPCSTTRRTSRSTVARSASSTAGSRLPCSERPGPTRRAASSSGTRQSTPTTSAPGVADQRQQLAGADPEVDARHVAASRSPRRPRASAAAPAPRSRPPTARRPRSRTAAPRRRRRRSGPSGTWPPRAPGAPAAATTPPARRT